MIAQPIHTCQMDTHFLNQWKSPTNEVRHGDYANSVLEGVNRVNKFLYQEAIDLIGREKHRRDIKTKIAKACLIVLGRGVIMCDVRPNKGTYAIVNGIEIKNRYGVLTCPCSDNDTNQFCEHNLAAILWGRSKYAELEYRFYLNEIQQSPNEVDYCVVCEEVMYGIEVVNYGNVCHDCFSGRYDDIPFDFSVKQSDMQSFDYDDIPL